MKKSKITLESLVESYKLSKNKDLLFNNAVKLFTVLSNNSEVIKLQYENFDHKIIVEIPNTEGTPIFNDVIRYIKENFSFKEYEVFKLDDELNIASVNVEIGSDVWKVDKQLISFYNTEDVSILNFDEVTVFRLFHDDNDEDTYTVDFINIENDEALLDFSFTVEKSKIDEENGTSLHIEMCKEFVRDQTGLCWHSIFTVGDYIHISFLDMLKVNDDNSETIEITDGTERVVINKSMVFWLSNKLMKSIGYTNFYDNED
jgi:hypothetical protein